MPTVDEIAATIRELAARWGSSPQEINNGQCEDFAIAVANHLGLNAWKLLMANPVEELLGHIWLTINGRHYDAEMPEGEDSWWDLPIYRRIKDHPYYRQFFADGEKP